MQVTPRMILNTLTTNVNTQQERLLALQSEAATGQRFQYPWDSPNRVTGAMTLTTSLSHVSTYQKSATAAQSWLNQTNGVLTNAVSLWRNAMSVAVQGANSSLTGSDRQALSQTIHEAQKSLGQLWDTQYQGLYLFSGTSSTMPVPVTGSPPQYPTTLTSWPSTAQEARVFQIGPSSSVTVNLTGYEPVGQSSPTTSYFQTLYNDLGQLATNLKSGASTVQGQLGSLQNDLTTLTTAQSIVGSRLQRITNTVSQLHTAQFDLTQSLSQTSGANMTSVMANLAQTQQALQAALQSGSQTLPLSLLSYIHP